MSLCCDDGTDAGMSTYPLYRMRSTDVGCLPHPTDCDHFAGDLLPHALCPPLSQSTLLALSLSVSARRGREVGFTTWRVWPGCDCSGRFLALYLSTFAFLKSTRPFVSEACRLPNGRSRIYSSAMKNWSRSVFRTSNGYVSDSKSKDRS